MDDLIELHRGKEFVHRVRIAKVAVKKFKRLGKRLDVAEIGALDLRIVKAVQIIKRPNAMAIAEQAFANVRADETRAAGDEKIHDRKLTSDGESVERQALGFWP